VAHVDDLVKAMPEQLGALRMRFFGFHRRKNLQEISPVLIVFLQILQPKKRYLLQYIKASSIVQNRRAI